MQSTANVFCLAFRFGKLLKKTVPLNILNMLKLDRKGIEV